MLQILHTTNLWEMPTIGHEQHDILAPHREWIAQLCATERTIFDTAYALYNTLTVAGGCYHNSFFLRYYLKKRFNIDGRVEVGFINDGTDSRYASHAWYVYKNTITDLAVSRPFDPEHTYIGPLTILGRTLIDGWTWSHHDTLSAKGIVAMSTLLSSTSSDPYDLASQAKYTHLIVAKAAQSTAGIRAYLDGGHRGMTYADIVEKLTRWHAQHPATN